MYIICVLLVNWYCIGMYAKLIYKGYVLLVSLFVYCLLQCSVDIELVFFYVYRLLIQVGCMCTAFKYELTIHVNSLLAQVSSMMHHKLVIAS